MQGFVDHGVTGGHCWIDADMPPVSFAVNERVLVVDVAFGDVAPPDLGEDTHQQRRPILAPHGVYTGCSAPPGRHIVAGPR